MSVLRYVRLDVFSNQPFTGIQLAVFPDAAGIDERRMQRIANEMALPETTFVFPPEAPETDARVRIFTPTRELPMAGSPTIGTVFALAGAGRLRASAVFMMAIPGIRSLLVEPTMLSSTCCTTLVSYR